MLKATIENLTMMVAFITVTGKKTLPTSEFFIDTQNGETGRYFVSLGNYLCHYGGAFTFLNTNTAFSEQCYIQNRKMLSRRENNSKTYPYFDSSVGAPPGCGPLPVVDDGEWVCPDGVSPLAVPVYESCRILCKGESDSLQKRTPTKVRCTEKLEWDRTLLLTACQHRQDPDIMKISLIILLVVAVAFLILFCVFRKLKRGICNDLQKLLCNTIYQDNNRELNSVDTLGMENNDRQQIVVTENAAKCGVSSSNSNVEKGQSTSQNSAIDQCTCVSNGTLQMSNLTDIDIFQKSNCNNLDITNASNRADGMSKLNIHQNDADQFNENVKPGTSLPSSHLLASNGELGALCNSSKKTENMQNVKKDEAFMSGYPLTHNEATHAGSCPTIAAMLEGAVDDSIRFVDDLSTLLDPDNPRNWQGLAQSSFNLSFNKIKEIRHKTKDHFKEAILPMLSSHGFSIFDLTYYFYKLPSRRIDVIECIQRYHPYCRDCGEIYSCIKSRKID